MRRRRATCCPVDLFATKALSLEFCGSCEGVCVVMQPHSCVVCDERTVTRCRCCNTCEDVREAYRQKGWAINKMENIEQCKREGWEEKIKEEEGEGCRVYGYLEVNKVR